MFRRSDRCGRAEVRAHLEKCAERIGTPLSSLFQLDRDAVRLLPPAYTSELHECGHEVRRDRQGRGYAALEICRWQCGGG